MKLLGLRLAASLIRAYMQHVPVTAAKAWLWEQVIRPYLAWRPIEIDAPTKFGAVFHGRLDDSIMKYLYFFGEFEPAVVAVFRDRLRPGDVVIDVGANIGVHTVLAAGLVGPKGHVHAIEASPWIFERLNASLRTNGIDNVSTYHVAAMDRPGRVPVFLHDPSNLGGTTVVPGVAAMRTVTPEAEVEGLPLPEILPLSVLRAARLIKIDVEGAEWLVVKSLQPVLAELSPDVTILIELTASALAEFGATPGDFLDLFAAAGFEAFAVPNRYDAAFYIEGPPAMPTRPITTGQIGDATIDLMLRRRAA